MSKYEKLGGFLLFDKVEEDKLSKNFVAGQINNNQIQQIHWIKKFDHSLSSMPDFILDMNQEMEILKALSNPALIRPGDIVKDKAEFAAIFDYFEGKSLRSVLQKCTQEGYPFTADHALLIASRVCAALEYLHSKKVKDQRLVHGYVSPESIFITYDGETKVQYLGLAQLLLKNTATRDRFLQTHKNYFAPEVVQTHKLDKAADIFSTGCVLYEMLTGEALYAKGRDVNIPQAIDQAMMHNQSGDKIPVPDEIKKALHQALASDSSQRFNSISELRKILDQQLFTSDYSPTTFNLAFFMNSLFRENMDQEGKNLKDYKKLDVTTYLKEQPAPGPVAPKVEHPVGAEPAKDIPVTPLGIPKPVPSFGGIEELPVEKEKSKTPMFIGILIAVAVLGVGAYFFLKPSSPAPTQAAAIPHSINQQPVSDAERSRLQQEALAAQEEAKKKDQQLKDLQTKLDQLLKAQKDAKASATTPPVDKETIQQLQQQAKQLEEERKRQEALAAEKLKAAAAPPPPVETPAEDKPVETIAQNQPVQNQPAPAVQNEPAQKEPAPVEKQQDTPAVTQPQPAVAKTDTEPAASQVQEGDTVEMAPDVVKPEMVTRVQPIYPPVAKTMKVQGTVILSILVTETGNVSEVRVLRPVGGSAGLNEAAIAAAKKWKFRPAVKQGKKVKVWMTYPVSFKLEG
ncbi:TonB family protein [bacterium]|nr:TonB family protein [bacterium]